MNKTHRVGAVMVFLVLAALACSAPSATTPTPGITEIFPLPDTAVPTGEATPVSSGTALTLDQLKNMTYQVEIAPSGQAVLSNGTYSEPNPELGGDTVVQLLEPAAFGDLNGDGAPDAIVRLLIQTGTTTGRFSYMVAVLNQNGTPQQAAFTFLGDRVMINGFSIDASGLITADMVVAGPNDGMCCPNTPALRTFRLEGSALVEYVNGATATPYILPLDYEMFKNLTYHDVQQPGETFTLAGGTFSGDIGQGPQTITLADWIMQGDLTGDGVPDSVTVLIADPEGTGVFYYLVAIHNNYGVPEHVATAYLGDRVIVEVIQIEGGIITVDMKVAGPGDGACCPNTPETKKLKLEGTQLVPVP